MEQDKTQPEDITETRAAELMQVQNTMAVADQAVMDMAPVSEALGRIKAAEFFRHVGDVIIAQTFVELRNSKRYKEYPIKDADGNLRRCQNFEEFCQAAFGKSYTRCYELSKNLHLLGPELYESAERIGFKARDYAALKALPESEQEVVKQALAAESKDQVLDILQDLAARHQSERQAAKKQAEGLKADLDARDKLLEEKSARADKLSLELTKLKSLPPNEKARLILEQEQDAAERIQAASVKAEGELNLFLGEVADVLGQDGLSQAARDHAHYCVRFLCESLAEYIEENNIDVDFQGMIRPVFSRAQAAKDHGLAGEE